MIFIIMNVRGKRKIIMWAKPDMEKDINKKDDDERFTLLSK